MFLDLNVFLQETDYSHINCFRNKDVSVEHFTALLVICLYSVFFIHLSFDPENGSHMFHRNVC
jgi:hypothetical protein